MVLSKCSIVEALPDFISGDRIEFVRRISFKPGVMTALLQQDKTEVLQNTPERSKGSEIGNKFTGNGCHFTGSTLSAMDDGYIERLFTIS